MLTAVGVLEHLERKLETLLQSGESPERLEELARFVREIAEAALVTGDEVTLQEARRLAARLGPFGLGASISEKPPRPARARTFGPRPAAWNGWARRSARPAPGNSWPASACRGRGMPCPTAG
jgi:hypothetical protein